MAKQAIEKRTTEIDAPELKLTPEVVHRHVNQYASREEIEMFLEICRLWDLNPFKREIYLIKYNKSQPASIVVGYETYVKRAEKSKKWDGIDKGFEYKETSKGKTTLVAWCKIYRKDWSRPLHHEVWWDEYAQYTNQGQLTKFWKKMPKTMLMKVCLGQAFRLAFPAEVGGMPYTADEIPEAQEMGDIQYTKPEQKETPEEKPQEKPENKEKAETKGKGKAKQEKAKDADDAKQKQEKKAKEEPKKEKKEKKEEEKPEEPPEADGPEEEEIVDAEIVEEEEEGGEGEPPEDEKLENIKRGIGHQIDRLEKLGRDRNKLIAKIIERLEMQFDTHYSEIPGSLDYEAASFLSQLLAESIEVAEEEANE
jgi:phage recombination protein Bet